MAIIRNLTPKGIEALKPPVGKDRDYISDSGIGSVQGLVLMLTAKGAKSWLWRSRHHETGKQIKKTLGSYPAFGLADAREWATAQNRARAEGYDLDARRAEEKAVEEAERAKVEAESLKTLSWYWTEHYVPTFIGDTKGNETARLIEKHLIPTLGANPLGEITEDDLGDIIAAFAKRAPGSAQRLVDVTKTLFRRAKRDHKRETKLATNPAEDLIAPRRTVAVKDRSLTDAEIVYFYRALSRATGWVRVHGECLALCLDVGGRIDEARCMKFTEVDFTKGVWELPPERAKNGKAHVMKLPPIVLDRLKERRKLTNQDWVFASPLSDGQAYNSASKAQPRLRKLMADIALSEGVLIPSWSAHDLRRTFKSHLYEAAANSRHPLVTEANIDRAQNHRTGSDMGRRYDKNQYVNEKGAVYRYWQDHLSKLRAKAEKAEAKASRASEGVEALAA